LAIRETVMFLYKQNKPLTTYSVNSFSCQINNNAILYNYNFYYVCMHLLFNGLTSFDLYFETFKQL